MLKDSKEVKQKACKSCGQKFKPHMSTQKACSVRCALDLAPANRDKAKKAIEQRERADTRARKERLKSKGDYLREAQIAFNAYIRMRDRLAGHPCISSGRPLDWNGNAVDAGHYRSVGAAPHLRFDERNCHAQSKEQNRYLSGNAIDYRVGLIQRIGLQALEALEADQSERRYTIEDLKAVKAKYREKLKVLKRASQD